MCVCVCVCVRACVLPCVPEYVCVCMCGVICISVRLIPFPKNNQGLFDLSPSALCTQVLLHDTDKEEVKAVC